MLDTGRDIVLVAYTDEDLSIMALGQAVPTYLALDHASLILKDLLREQYSPKTTH